MSDSLSLVGVDDGVRRRYPVEYKRQVVPESMMGGASIARVALAHGINANPLHNWRWQYRRGDFGPVPQGPGLLPVQIKGASVTRTEEPRVGEEGCRKCRFRWCPDHVKKQTQ